MQAKSSTPTITAEYTATTTPYAVAFQRGVGYVVVERDTLLVLSEFDATSAGHISAREHADALNLDYATDLADSAAALTAYATEQDAAAERDAAMCNRCGAFRASRTAPCVYCAVEAESAAAEQRLNELEASTRTLLANVTAIQAQAQISPDDRRRLDHQLRGDAQMAVTRRFEPLTWTALLAALTPEQQAGIVARADRADRVAELVAAGHDPVLAYAALLTGELAVLCPRCGNSRQWCCCQDEAGAVVMPAPGPGSPSTPAAARLVWSWQGTAAALSDLICERRKAVV